MNYVENTSAMCGAANLSQSEIFEQGCASADLRLQTTDFEKRRLVYQFNGSMGQLVN